MSYHFSHTPFPGHEQEILDILHRNRDEVFSLEYLQWRYLGEQTEKPPVVFWVQNDTGKKIGICSLIFRKYWIDNEPQLVAVAGDTSLDASYRGQGIAKRLFNYMNTCLNDSGCPYALALANESFGRAATAAGWVIDQAMVPFVYVLDWKHFLARFLPNRFLANGAGALLNAVTRRHHFLKEPNGFTCSDRTTIDPKVDLLWKSFDKKNLLIKDRSLPTLEWRYTSIHQGKYAFFHVYRNASLCGCIVYSLIKSVCYISDVLVSANEILNPCFSQFCKHLISLENIGTIRITMNYNHPFAVFLRRSGFVARQADAQFVLRETVQKEAYNRRENYILIGDKDI